jgi:hypothetical protein
VSSASGDALAPRIAPKATVTAGKPPPSNSSSWGASARRSAGACFEANGDSVLDNKCVRGQGGASSYRV